MSAGLSRLLPRKLAKARRFGWGVADQAVSSLTNAAVSFYVARELGAAQFGAFSLAYVTYSLVVNASRGLATDPLAVRYSSAELPVWRRAVAGSTGTAIAVGGVASLCVLTAAVLLGGTTKMAFIALGMMLPGLMLQDSWRFAFFALGRGSQACLNDTIQGVALVPALLLLKLTHHSDVFSFVLAWGASANIAAAVGPFQARVIPRVDQAWAWIWQHRDLGPRYLLENTANSASGQVRIYGVGLILGLSAVGYLEAAALLMGPFMALLMGTLLVTVPEAARVLQRSPERLWRFCLVLGAGLGLAAFAWGATLILLMPLGLGHLLIGPIWRQAYPLMLPTTLWFTGTGVGIGASAGLRALGASRRSLLAQTSYSVVSVIIYLIGAYYGGAMGAAVAGAIAVVPGTVFWWYQLRAGPARRQRQIPGHPRRPSITVCDTAQVPGGQRCGARPSRPPERPAPSAPGLPSCPGSRVQCRRGARQPPRDGANQATHGFRRRPRPRPRDTLGRSTRLGCRSGRASGPRWSLQTRPTMTRCGYRSLTLAPCPRFRPSVAIGDSYSPGIGYASAGAEPQAIIRWRLTFPSRLRTRASVACTRSWSLSRMVPGRLSIQARSTAPC